MKIMRFLTSTTGGVPPVPYEKNKDYWLHDDSAMFHREAGTAIDAPPDAVPVNDKPLPRRNSATVRVTRAGGNLRNVEVMGVRANSEPLSIRAAEKLQADLIAGRVTLPQAAVGLVSSPAIQAPPPAAPPAALDPDGKPATTTGAPGGVAAAVEPAPVPPEEPAAVVVEPAPVAETVAEAPVDQKPETDLGVAVEQVKPEVPVLTLKHAGGGRFNVLDASGAKVNDGVLTRQEAEAFIAERTTKAE